jgi:hypothetical protein
MNTPRSGRPPGGKPQPEKKTRNNIETPEEEAYARGETRPGDEGYVGTKPSYRSDADRAIGAAGHTVKTGIASSLRGIDEIESEIVSLVRNTVSNTLRATGAVGAEAVDITRDVVKGALAATEDAGTGLALSTKCVA